jgi:hypothetical protein
MIFSTEKKSETSDDKDFPNPGNSAGSGVAVDPFPVATPRHPNPRKNQTKANDQLSRTRRNLTSSPARSQDPVPRPLSQPRRIRAPKHIPTRTRPQPHAQPHPLRNTTSFRIEIDSGTQNSPAQISSDMAMTVGDWLSASLPVGRGVVWYGRSG